ncbi:MAG: hypothetical protein ABI551_17040 [Polyangiaceae bacterium]
MRDRKRLGLAVLGVVAISLSAAPAYADATGAKAMGEIFAIMVGIVALALAALLGALAWFKVLRPPKSAAGVFGRGFAGVSAALAFAVGVTAFAMGFDVKTPWMTVGFVLIVVVMAAEFVIAGMLYLRVHRARPSSAARWLAFASFAVGGLFVLSAVLVVVVSVLMLAFPATSHVPDREVRGYQKGCGADNGSDCNMLGLRYKEGNGGLARDPVRAAASFRKACDLGASAGCRNVAAMYSEGDGIPKDEALAHEYFERYAKLESHPE